MLVLVSAAALLTFSAAPPTFGQDKDPKIPRGDDLELKDAGKLRLQLDFGEHAFSLNRLMFADSKSLITVSSDHTIRITDAVTGENRKILYPPGFGALKETALSADGKTLAVSTQYAEIGKTIPVVYLMTIPDGGIVRVFKNLSLPFVPFAADGKSLVFYNDKDRKFQIFNLDKDEPGLEVLNPGAAVNPLFPHRDGSPLLASLSPDGRRLAVPEKDDLFGVYDVQTGKRTNLQIKGRKFAWSPDGKTLAALNLGPSTLSLHEPDGKLRKSMGFPGRSCNSITFAANSKTLACLWSNQGTLGTLSLSSYGLSLVDVSTLQETMLVSGKDKTIRQVMFGILSPDGQLAAANTAIQKDGVQYSTCVFVWQTSDYKMVKRFDLKSAINFDRASWSADGKSVTWKSQAGVSERSFHLGDWLLRPGLQEKDIQGGPIVPNFSVRKDIYSAPLVQGELSVRYDQKSRGSKISNGKIVLGEFKGFALKFFGTDWLIARNGNDFNLVEVKTGKLVRTWNTQRGAWISLAFSPDGRYLLTRDADRALRVWSLKQDDPLLSLVYLKDDWIAWTEEGYYAATPGGERIMGWTVDNGIDKSPSFFPAERFRKKLFRPDIIKLVLEKGSVKEAIKTANAAAGIEKTRDVKIDDLRPPRAVLALLQQDKAVVKLIVAAEASSTDQPVTALRLLVDGRPLADGSANEKFEGGKKQANAEWSIALPPGKHLLTVLVRCPDASSKSNSVEVIVADPSKQSTLHVLAIGVNEYQDSSLKLEFAAKDAEEIAAGFQKSSRGDLFQDVRSKVLTNAAAGKVAILKQIAELRKKARPSDLAVVFFAGHGVKEKDKFYLLPVDAKTDNLAGTAISGEELRKALGEFPCQVLLMLDACHSSAGIKNFRPAVDDITRNLTDDDCGVAVLCAAMAHEKALDKEGNGLFTRAVVQALNRAEGVPFNRYNRLMYVDHLHTFVRDEVSQLSGDRQHPFLSLPWVVESFPVAKFASK